MPSKVEKALGKFAGREILVKEAFNGQSGATYWVKLLHNPEPIYEDMKRIAGRYGYEFRLLCADAIVKEQEDLSRITAFLEKDKSDAWHISPNFRIG